MTRTAVTALAVLLSSAALAHDSAPAKPATAPAVKAATMEKGKVLARGEKLKGLPAVALADLVGTPEKYQDKSVRLEGTVRRACDRMGCWMELAESDSGAGVRVTFKDYGFFVPVDSAGETAKVAGTVKVTALTEAAAKHYQAEGGRVPTDAQGKHREVQLVATGVELRR